MSCHGRQPLPASAPTQGDSGKQRGSRHSGLPALRFQCFRSTAPAVPIKWQVLKMEGSWLSSGSLGGEALHVSDSLRVQNCSH